MSFAYQMSTRSLTGQITRHGPGLDTADIVSRLSKRVPGVHADPGGRVNIWHPDIDVHQGVYYFHKHLSSMDRGTTPQWPEFKCEDHLVSVPLDYAIRHDEFPVVNLPMDTLEPDWMNPEQHAEILRAGLGEVVKIGWAEVFFRILRYGLPGVDKTWLAAEFAVPMDWYDTLTESPIHAIVEQCRKKGWA